MSLTSAAAFFFMALSAFFSVAAGIATYLQHSLGGL